MRPSQAYPAERTVARLDRERQRLGITQQAIAERASKTSKRGTVGITTVSKVLAYQRKSLNVVVTVKQMIAEKKAQREAVAAA